MSGDITPYLGLITSEYADQPNFLATVGLSVQPLADALATIAAAPALFDLDVAVGDQLDKTGQWIGPTRFLPRAVTDVFFSFDIPGLGFDQGVWEGPFNPVDSVIQLPDDAYRLLLQVTAAANQWNGTIPGLYDTWAILFNAEGGQVLIKDNGNSTMTITFQGVPLTALVKALIQEELLLLVPVTRGVTVVFS